eukprot:3701021-Pleurochrysis_carterae.AAC.1
MHWMTRAVLGRRRRGMLVIGGCRICVSSRTGNAISSINCRLSSQSCRRQWKLALQWGVVLSPLIR